MTPAQLDALLRVKRHPKAEYDANGKCLHVRYCYQDLGRIGRNVCPDCGDIDWKGEWREQRSDGSA